MRVTVNGQPYETGVATLAELLSELDYDGAVVATALNGEFAPKGKRLETTITENDAIEVIAPMKGG